MASSDWWVRMRIGLADEPEVVRMAEALKLDPDAVVGKLLRVWGWAKRVTKDGRVASRARHVDDALARVTGFAAAMAEVGWLRVTEGGLEFPRFEVYLGQEARRRSLSADRSRRYRQRQASHDRARDGDVTSRARGEKKKEDTPPPPQHDSEGLGERESWGGAGGVVTPARVTGGGTELDRNFEEFWAAYPPHRRLARSLRAAKYEWLQVSPAGELFARLMARLARDKLSKQWVSDGGEFVPRPERWLADRPWEAGEPPRPETPAERLLRLQEEDRCRRNGTTGS